MSSHINSYTAAGNVPVKLLQDTYVINELKKGNVPCRHIQLIPTNRCNLSCPWCSCAEEDRKKELNYEEICSIISNLPESVAAVTITGGGEPLLHPYIVAIALLFKMKKIKVGLVTNGTLLHKTNGVLWDSVDWCRISVGDGRNIGQEYFDRIEKVTSEYPHVDWAFSYVLSSTPDIWALESAIDLAAKQNFTHVRVVTDLLSVEDSPIEKIESELGLGRDLSHVIFQNRKKYEQGGKCWMGLLKPVIGADGISYQCCGAQYALDPPSKKMPEELKCNGDGAFDGTICKRCYYMDYNRLIEMFMQKLEHSEWV